MNGLPQIKFHTSWLNKTPAWKEDFRMTLVLYITVFLFTTTQNFFHSGNKEIVSLSRSPPLNQETAEL